MTIKKIHKLEQAVVWFFNFEGWDLNTQVASLNTMMLRASLQKVESV